MDSVVYLRNRIRLMLICISLSLLGLSTLAYVCVNQKALMGQMQNQFVNYRDPIFGFEIQYPNDWEKIQFAQGITEGSHNMVVNFLSPQGGASQIFREYLLIEVANVTSVSSNQSAFSRGELNFLTQSFPHFLPIKINASSTLDGHKAYSVLFTYDDPIVGKGKAMTVWTLNGSKGYILSYHADSSNYNKYLPTIAKMINSFRIISK